jgi:hypothetical protein
MSDEARLARAAARRRRPEDFPIRRFEIDDEPVVDQRVATTVDQRIHECLRLSRLMFEVAGGALPRYRRAEIPGRVLRAAK